MTDLNRLREMAGLELKEEGGNFADLDQLQEYIYDTFNRHECCVGQDGNYLWCQLPYSGGDVDFDRERGSIDGKIIVEVDGSNDRVVVTGDIVHNTENDMEVYEDDYLVLSYEISHDPEEINREVQGFCQRMLKVLKDYDDEIRQPQPKQVEGIDRMRELAGLQEKEDKDEDKEKKDEVDSEKLREWANSLAKNYEDRGKVFKQPEGETVDISLRRYLNAKAMPVRIEENIDDKKLLKEWKKFKSSK